MGIEALVPRMRMVCGAGNVITDPLELRTYECDGLTSHRCVPAPQMSRIRGTSASMPITAPHRDSPVV